DALHLQFQIDDRVNAAAEIESRDTERFVHGHHEVARTIDSATVTERLRHGLAEGNAYVFDRVVLVDVEVARSVNLQIEATMPRNELQHVIEKTDSGADV